MRITGLSYWLAILKVKCLISDTSVHEFTTAEAKYRCMTSVARTCRDVIKYQLFLTALREGVSTSTD